MENFTAISKRPFFSQSIRMIFYDTVLYDMYIPELTSNERSREPCGEESYRHGLNVYRRAYADHEAILDTGEDFAVLKTGLDLMPDVKEVRVSDGLRYELFRDWYDHKDPGCWDTPPGSFPCFFDRIPYHRFGGTMGFAYHPTHLSRTLIFRHENLAPITEGRVE